jgi:hypothetical protein
MNNFTKFLKTSLSGGFFVLMPLIMFYLLVDEMIELLVAEYHEPLLWRTSRYRHHHHAAQVAIKCPAYDRQDLFAL